MFSKNTIHLSRGFTIIELVLVIVLISFLAATVLPNMMNLTDQARSAAAARANGAMGSAVAIIHSKWIADGGVPTSSIDLESTKVYVSIEGWPEATSAAGNGMMTAAKCLEVWNGILASPPSANVLGSCNTNNGCEFLVRVRSYDPTICEYIDGAGTGSNTITYDINVGDVNLEIA